MSQILLISELREPFIPWQASRMAVCQAMSAGMPLSIKGGSGEF